LDIAIQSSAISMRILLHVLLTDKVLLKAVRVAKSHGFKVLHGIVDSIWVVKQGAVREDYLKLKEAIEQHAYRFCNII
jgi:DNA polymerase elongation subunit (family B)